MNDTSPEAEETRLRVLRAMSPARRLTLALGWSSSVRGMVKANLKKQFPNATEAQRHRMFAERCLGPELAAKAYGGSDGHG